VEFALAVSASTGPTEIRVLAARLEVVCGVYGWLRERGVPVDPERLVTWLAEVAGRAE